MKSALNSLLEQEWREDHAYHHTEDINKIEYLFITYNGLLLRKPQEIIRVSKNTLTQIKYLLKKLCLFIELFLFYSVGYLFTLSGFPVGVIIGNYYNWSSDNLIWLMFTISLFNMVLWMCIYYMIIYKKHRKKLEIKIKKLIQPYGNYEWNEVGTVKFRGTKYVVLPKT